MIFLSFVSAFLNSANSAEALQSEVIPEECVGTINLFNNCLNKFTGGNATVLNLVTIGCTECRIEYADMKYKCENVPDDNKIVFENTLTCFQIGESFCFSEFYDNKAKMSNYQNSIQPFDCVNQCHKYIAISRINNGLIVPGPRKEGSTIWTLDDVAGCVGSTCDKTFNAYALCADDMLNSDSYPLDKSQQQEYICTNCQEKYSKFQCGCTLDQKDKNGYIQLADLQCKKDSQSNYCLSQIYVSGTTDLQAFNCNSECHRYFYQKFFTKDPLFKDFVGNTSRWDSIGWNRDSWNSCQSNAMVPNAVCQVTEQQSASNVISWTLFATIVTIIN